MQNSLTSTDDRKSGGILKKSQGTSLVPVCGTSVWNYTASSIILLYLLRYNHVTIKGHILEIAFRFFGVFFLNLLVKQAKLNFCKMDWSQFHFLLLGTSTEKRASTDDKQPARERGGAVGPAPAQNR